MRARARDIHPVTESRPLRGRVVRSFKVPPNAPGEPILSLAGLKSSLLLRRDIRFSMYNSPDLRLVPPMRAVPSLRIDV